MTVADARAGCGVREQVGMGGMECYTEDFETYLLSETAAFYKKKAAAWIVVRVSHGQPAQNTMLHICL